MKNDKKNILIGALLFALVALVIAYATNSTTTSINSKEEKQKWNVKIINIKNEIKGSGIDEIKPTNTRTTASFNPKLTKVGDSVSYKIKVKNNGTIDAKFSNIELFPINKTSGVIYTVVDQPTKNSVLSSGETTMFKVKAEYTNEELETNRLRPFSCVIEYAQK